MLVLEKPKQNIKPFTKTNSWTTRSFVGDHLTFNYIDP